jgi:hypothetical protein
VRLHGWARDQAALTVQRTTKVGVFPPIRWACATYRATSLSGSKIACTTITKVLQKMAAPGSLGATRAGLCVAVAGSNHLGVTRVGDRGGSFGAPCSWVGFRLARPLRPLKASPVCIHKSCLLKPPGSGGPARFGSFPVRHVRDPTCETLWVSESRSFSQIKLCDAGATFSRGRPECKARAGIRCSGSKNSSQRKPEPQRPRGFIMGCAPRDAT